MIDDSDQRALEIDDQELLRPHLEHVDQRVEREAVGACGQRRLPHDLRDGRVGGDVARHDLLAQVAVGDDTVPRTQPNHGAGLVLLRHPDRDVPDRRLRGAHEG